MAMLGHSFKTGMKRGGLGRRMRGSSLLGNTSQQSSAAGGSEMTLLPQSSKGDWSFEYTPEGVGMTAEEAWSAYSPYMSEEEKAYYESAGMVIAEPEEEKEKGYEYGVPITPTLLLEQREKADAIAVAKAKIDINAHVKKYWWLYAIGGVVGVTGIVYMANQ